MEKQLLEMKNIHKKFPGVYALKGVNLQLYSGEVLAIVGENGAGKSTLINVLGGIHKKDEGEIIIDGQNTVIDNVLDAQKAGISIIHQELVLVPYLTAAENIFINREPRNKAGLIDYKKMFRDAQTFIDDLGLSISADTKIINMTIAQQQMVEIVKAVSFNARIIVMDEPTSSISDKEVESLFNNIKKLKSRGIGIIYISHKLSELKQISDSVMVLRDGETIASKTISEVTNDELVKLMVGREVTNYYTRTFNSMDETALRVTNLTTDKIKNVSFDIKRGEILGFAGLVGAGRTETIKGMLGFDKLKTGTIEIDGKTCKIKRPADAYEMGIGFIPESRREESLFPVMPVQFNLTIKDLKEFIHGIRVNSTKERAVTAGYIEKLSIKTPSQDACIQNLSGGNQQKVIISSWLATKPKLLIMDEPTRGIDVGAKAEIYALMNQLAQEGIAIIMISSELPEIINMSDRVVVMRDGQVSKVLERDEISQEEIMKFAVDVHV